MRKYITGKEADAFEAWLEDMVQPEIHHPLSETGVTYRMVLEHFRWVRYEPEFEREMRRKDAKRR